MEIGFINFNQEVLNRANKVMKLLEGQGAIDELGLGRIRDAFSNMMFPGMSTLQTRAKYFLLMPALYAFLEHYKIQDARDARAKIREHEISLTLRLMEGTPKEIASGIIGASALEKGESYVKYDPAYVYQVGMETYGLIKSGGNIYRMIAERSSAYSDCPKRYRSDSGLEDSEDLNGTHPVFLTCGEHYDFKSKSPLSMALTHREADFLKKQIVANTPGSLIAFLLDSDLYLTATENDFETLEEKLIDIVPAPLFQVYVLARRYARFAYLLRARYAMLYDMAVGAMEDARKREDEFFKILRMYKSEFTPEAIEEVIELASQRVSEETCKIFCRKAATLIEQENWDRLDDLIVNREVEIKTAKRSKLKNAKDFEQGKPFETPAIMSFRWNTIVRDILNEIRYGLKDE